MGGCDKPLPPPAEVSRPVKIMTIGAGGGDMILEYPGKVAAAEEAKLAFEIPGKIVELSVSEGQKITKGTLIARLDERDYKSTFEGAKSLLETAEANYSRGAKLKEQGFISQADYDALNSKLGRAKSQFEIAEKAFQDTQLLAPFNGTVASKFVENFTNVQAKQPVVLLHDKTGLEVEINIPENDWKHAKPGLSEEERRQNTQSKVVISPFPNREFNAVVKSLSTVADPTTLTFEATLSFSAPDDIVIMPGMSAKVRIAVKEAKAGRVSVPARAVAADPQGQAYVWLVDAEMKVSRRFVTLGELDDSGMEVSEGLAEGERIAITGVSQLREGMEVSALGDK